MSNPFYAGYVTGKLVNGKLIKGKHPALIDLKTFSKANDFLNTAPTAGIAKKSIVEELPLKIFAKDEISGCRFTGYQKKGHWYYKTRNGTGKVNINASRLNEQFANLLENFEFAKAQEVELKKVLTAKIRKRLEYEINENIKVKKRLTELQNQLEGIEKRYVVGLLEKPLYEKYTANFHADMDALNGQIEKSTFDSSNLERIVNRGVQIAKNIRQLWVSADFRNKQKLQYLIFPEGILYSKEKNRVRTEVVNSLFAEIPLLTRVLGGNEKGNLEKDCLKSNSVPGTGIEPAHPCGRQILSLLRLPFSPPGQYVRSKIFPCAAPKSACNE